MGVVSGYQFNDVFILKKRKENEKEKEVHER